jgi:hypothetical protein
MAHGFNFFHTLLYWNAIQQNEHNNQQLTFGLHSVNHDLLVKGNFPGKFGLTSLE